MNTNSFLFSVIGLSIACVTVYGFREKREDLWDDVSTQSPPNSVVNFNPTQLESSDENIRNTLFLTLASFSKSLVLYEDIVVAAYKVADYVPDLENDKHADFWKKIIPNLVKSLKEDVKAHSLVVKSISAIRDLSIVIQNAGEIVLQSRGSNKSIEIAQKNIPLALQELTNYSVLVSKIETSAIETFGNQTDEIFNIIGPEAVKFVEQRADIESQINELYENQQKLYTKLAMKKGELAGLNYLLNSTIKQLYGAEQAVNESKNRTDALNQLNLEVEKTISSIPISTTQAVTTTTHYRTGFLWFWGSSGTSTQTKNVNVPNPDRDAQIKYYDNIVKSRVERIKASETEEIAREKVVDELKLSITNLTGKYATAEAEYESYKDILPQNLQYIQGRLNNLTENMGRINEQEKNITNMVGLSGNFLIQCLTSVRKFSLTLGNGAKGYAPLVSILSGITKMVQSDVDLLSSTDKSDIFLADVRLLNKVGFLSNYTIVANEYLLSSKEFNSVINKIEAKKLY